MDDDERQEIIAAVASGGAIVCYSRCYPCMFESHFDPPKWHTWADADDIDNAKDTGQPDPRFSRCACHCAKAATDA